MKKKAAARGKAPKKASRKPVRRPGKGVALPGRGLSEITGFNPPDDPPGLGRSAPLLRERRSTLEGFKLPDDPPGIGGRGSRGGGRKPSGGGL